MLDGTHVTKYEDQFDKDLKYFLQEKSPETDLKDLECRNKKHY